jgi:hypothetical protein
MAESTGPILAIGAITVANRSIFHDKEMDWRVPAATGLAALMFTGAERVWGQGARMLAWTALIAVCLTRIEDDVPSPVESALLWWERPSKIGKRGSGRRERGPRERQTNV